MNLEDKMQDGICLVVRRPRVGQDLRASRSPRRPAKNVYPFFSVERGSSRGLALPSDHAFAFSDSIVPFNVPTEPLPAA